MIPQNITYMAEHANTQTARESWQRIIHRMSDKPKPVRPERINPEPEFETESKPVTRVRCKGGMSKPVSGTCGQCGQKTDVIGTMKNGRIKVHTIEVHVKESVK